MAATNRLDQILGALEPAPTAPAGGNPLDAILGPLDESNVNQMPELMGSAELGYTGGGTGGKLGLLDHVKSVGKLLFLSDPESIAKSLEGTPGIQIKRGKGNVPYAMVGGKSYSLNKAGLSAQDAIPLATALVTTAAVPGFGVAGLAARGAIQGGIGAGALSLAEQTAEKGPEALAEPGTYGQAAVSAGLGTGLGAAGGKLGQMIGGGRYAGRAARVLDAQGNPTETVRQAILHQGIDPDALPARILQRLDQDVGDRAGDPEIVRRALAQIDTELAPVPLTKAEASGNVGDFAKQVAYAEGIKGGPAAQTAMNFERGVRRPAMQQVTQDIAHPPGTAGMPGLPEADAGSAVSGALQQADQQAQQRVSAAYGAWEQAASQTGLAIPNDVAAFQQRLGRHLSPMGTINERVAPQTATTIADIERMLGRGPASTPQGLEGIRRIIVNARGRVSDDTESEALHRVQQAFDDYMDHAVGRATPGSPVGSQLQQMLRDARATAADRFNRFTVGQSRDPARKLVEDVVAGRVQPETLMTRLLGGEGRFTSSGRPYFEALQRALGRNHPIFDEVRSQAVKRILGGSVDQQALESLGPQGISGSIKRALDGRGMDYARQILPPSTLNQLQAFQRQMQRMQRPLLGQRNPAGSAFGVGSMAANAARRAVGTSIGTGIGSLIPIPGATIAGGMVGARAGEKLVERAAASSAEKIFRGRAPFRAGAAGTAGALRSLPGQALANSLPGLGAGLGAAGGGSIFDLYDDERLR